MRRILRMLPDSESHNSESKTQNGERTPGDSQYCHGSLVSRAERVITYILGVVGVLEQQACRR